MRDVESLITSCEKALAKLRREQIALHELENLPINGEHFGVISDFECGVDSWDEPTFTFKVELETVEIKVCVIRLLDSAQYYIEISSDSLYEDEPKSDKKLKINVTPSGIKAFSDVFKFLVDAAEVLENNAKN